MSIQVQLRESAWIAMVDVCAIAAGAFAALRYVESASPRNGGPYVVGVFLIGLLIMLVMQARRGHRGLTTAERMVGVCVQWMVCFCSAFAIAVIIIAMRSMR